jgi:hypothetical protein
MGALSGAFFSTKEDRYWESAVCHAGNVRTSFQLYFHQYGLHAGMLVARSHQSRDTNELTWFLNSFMTFISGMLCGNK